MASFKVRRNALFMNSACFTGAASFAGDMRVDSDFSASAISVSGGTNITHILAGSGAVSFGNLAASAPSTASITVTGLTTAHKCFLGASDISGCLTVQKLYSTAAGGELVIGVVNSASEQYTGATETFAYFAILDK